MARQHEIPQVPRVLRGTLQKLAKRALSPVETDASSIFPQLSSQQLSRDLMLRILWARPLSRAVIVLVSLLSAVCGLLAPWYQKIFVDALTTEQWTYRLSRHDLGLAVFADPLPRSIIFAFLAMFVSQALNLIARGLCSREAALMNAALGDMLYSHTLGLTAGARSGRTVGEIVNIYAQDISAAVSVIDEFLASILAALIPLLVAPFFVSMMLSMPLPAVMMVTLGCMAVLLAMSWRQSGFFDAFKRLAGERLAVVNEWLQNMRIIRILDWTAVFEEKIFSKRKEETINRLAMVTNGSIMNSIAQVAPLLINVVGIVVLLNYRRDATTAGDIFALMWVFGVFLARPIRNTPWTLVIYLDGLTSCRRLEAYFANPLEARAPVDQKVVSKAVAVSERWQSTDHAAALQARGLSLNYGGRPILRDLSFDISAGAFIAITGDVGAGKTQFLWALLKDNIAQFESYVIGGVDFTQAPPERVRQNFLYVPQDGFVMSASLGENIALTYDVNSSNHQDIIQSLAIADFNPRRERLEAGLATEIGERGVNLSGGQRQRVSLARAHYLGEHGKDRRIVLLDDCLNAVDVETERKLISDLLLGAWRLKTRILVTHRLSVLQHVDEVWSLENGSFKIERRKFP